MTHHRRHSHCSCTACPLSLPTRSPNTQNRRWPGRTILQKHGSDHLESCCNMLLEHQTALHSALHTREQPGRTFLQSMLHEHQMALVTSTHTTPGGGRKGAFVTAFQCLSVSPTQCLSALQHTGGGRAGADPAADGAVRALHRGLQAAARGESASVVTRQIWTVSSIIMALITSDCGFQTPV